jgi:formylglycine-generating enzyme required for sulfatase activity
LRATYFGADPPCLEYEYVEGGDLSGLILNWHRQDEKPSMESVATTLLQIAEIVAFAHLLDPPIVHRDLKPANILVQWSGGASVLKITDFGIGGIAVSKAIDVSRKATSTSQLLVTAMRGSGTLLYASPEQLRGDPPDPRDDVHALGVLWYQMLTGGLTKGRPGGSGWRRRFADRGMSVAMLDLLESCFEDQEDRPVDASVLAKKLSTILKSPHIETEREVTVRPSRSRKAEPPAPGKKRAGKESSNADQAVKILPEASLLLASQPLDEIVNSIGMKLRLIPAGEFMMGRTEAAKEAVRHLVVISQSFYVGIYPVTQGEYKQVVRKNPSHHSGDDRFPVENVSWFEAVKFCNLLSHKESLPVFYEIDGETVEVSDWNGTGYRLPTEAEWEYACRAGSQSRFYFGDDEKLLDNYAWHGTNSESKTQPVGEKKPNAFGLHDMHGNVWEWCWDVFRDDYYKKSPASDPRGPKPRKPELLLRRVVRGGSWYPADGWESSHREFRDANGRRRTIGFRVARGQHRS